MEGEGSKQKRHQVVHHRVNSLVTLALDFSVSSVSNMAALEDGP